MWGGNGGNSGKGVGDIENGIAQNGQLYPDMEENPQFRWAFIRKVYAILSMQILLTTAVAAVVVFCPGVQEFLTKTKTGHLIYFVMTIAPFIVLCILSCVHQRFPVNFLLLALFTIGMALGLGMTCAFTKGKIVLEAAILTSVVVVSLTLFTFWAAKRGMDFAFLGPFLFCSLLILMVFGLLQVFFPLGKLSQTIFAGLGAVLFSGYLIYDTDDVIKRFDYDEYIWASVTIYIDIYNIFTYLLILLRIVDG